MEFFRQNRGVLSQRFIAWLSCFAILLGSLAPAISHAIANIKGQPAPWSEICSTSGNKFVPFDISLAASNKESNDNDSQPMKMEHCAYCTMHAPTFALNDQRLLALQPANLSYSLPKLFYQAPYPLFAWASANPRAPPLNP